MKLQHAYETISDPGKRQAYDLRWPSIRDSLRTQQETEKRQAEQAEAEKKRAAEARARKQQEDTAREERLRIWEQSKGRYDWDIFELARATRKLTADLKRLKDLDDEDVRREKERNGWWAYLTSPIYGQVKETDEQKQQRKKGRFDRLASRRIKESELAEKEARLKKLQDALRDVTGQIAAEKKKAADEKNKVEEEARARRQQEARAREMREAQERLAEMQKRRAEQAAKEAREAQARWDAWEAQERARKEAKERAEAELRAAKERVEAEWRAAKERVEAEWRAARETAAAAAKQAKKAQNDRAGRASQSTCRHDGWWPKVEGKQFCGTCRTVQPRFALQCPGCKMVACASCQKSLRGARWKGNAGGRGGVGGGRSERHYGFKRTYDCGDDDVPFYDYDYDYD